MTVKKIILSLILTAALLSTLLQVAAAAEVITTYVDVNGVTQIVSATQITADTTTLSSGWYVADSSFTRDKVMTVSGSANLIIADGVYIGASEMVLDTNIIVSGSNSLTIYGQALGTGRLYIRGGPHGACIGGVENGTVGTITINGGTFELGGWYGSGLGGAAGSIGGTIIINGGTIQARGGIDCAGIGSGLNASGGSITINGGSVTAFGGVSGSGIGGGRGGSGWNVTINGGTVNAKGNTGGGSAGGAGIGGSYTCDGGSITINDGTVNATAGFSSAGIGGGAGKSGGVITINGGTINAYGMDGAGIGGGGGGSGGTITITSGVINAGSSPGGAGIGGGVGASSGTIRITGGIITATGGSGTFQVLGENHTYEVAGGPGIGSGVSAAIGTITIEGGTITATGGDGAYYSADNPYSFLGGGAGIGGGQFSGGGTISITGGTITATGRGGGTGIGGGENGAGGTINISGGNIKATGSESSPGIGGGQKKNCVTAISGGAVSISGGVVFSAAGPGISLYTEPTMDIGPGGDGTPGSLSISGTAAVFLRNDLCTAPTISVNHTHQTSVRPSLSTGGTYGFTLPNWGKAPNIGAYLYLIPITYHANQAGLPPEEETTTVTQHVGTNGALLGVAGARLNGFSLVNWNTAANGSGMSYMPQAPYMFIAPLTLYAQWEVSKYAVTWKTQDGSATLEADLDVTHGSQPSYDGANDPTKASTPQYDYTFAGWATSPGQTSGTPESELGAALDDTTYYAAFSETLRSYTVTWKSQDGSQTLETDIDVPYGTPVSFGAENPTKTDTAQYHYTFAGWAASPGQTSATAAGSLPTVSGPHTYYAAFNEAVRGYTVTFNSNGGSAVSSQNISYNNTAATPAAPLKAGHTLAGWYADSELTSAYSFSTPVTDNITLYAKWTANTYALSFNAQGGDAVSAVTVTYNAVVGELPTASRAGYTFAGWYTGINGAGTGYTAATIYQTAGNLTLYAKWTPNTYSLSFDAQGGDAVSDVTVTYNATVGVLPGALKAGYTLVGWYTGVNGAGTKYTAETVYQTAGNVTLYANWTQAPFTLSFDAQGGDPVSAVIVTYKAAVGVLPTASRAGYTFAGWYTETNGAGTEYAAVTVYEAVNDVTLFAKWTPNTYAITFDSQGGSAASPIEATYNAPIGPLPTASRAGCTFAGWYTATNGAGTNYTAATIYQTTDNLTLYAKWTTNTYAISFDAQGGSSTESSKNVIYGTAIGALTGALKTGYTLEGWYAGENGTGAKYTAETVYQTAGNMTLYANWSANTYTISFNSMGGTAVPPIDFTYNTALGTLPVPTKAGYLIVGWDTQPDGLGSRYSEETICLTAGNMTLYAVWDVAYSITYSLNEGTGTTPAEADKLAGATFSAADSAGMTAPSGKRFKEWNTAADGTGTGYRAGETVTVPDGNLLLYAIWENVPADPGYTATINTPSGEGMTLPVTVSRDTGTAIVDFSRYSMEQSATVVTIPTIPGVGTFTMGIPVPELSTDDGQSTLTINTGAGNITIPSDMLTGAAGNSGSKAEITIGQGDKSVLPDKVKASIGDKPLISLTLSIDGKQTAWHNPHAPVTVSIPYTPTPAELLNPDSIVIWYIDGAGKVITIPNGRFDPATGMVTFATNHFSNYAAAYNPVSFNDIKSGSWYYQAVSFIAAREITAGTGSDSYSPGKTLTRGEFLVMMLRAYGIAPELSPADNFADAGDCYFTGYLAAARHLGVSSGIGDNMFAPDKEITRQEMITLLYNALKVIGQLPQSDSGKKLSEFTDAGRIATWAHDALALFVGTGVIEGSSGSLNPSGIATRAEMAQLLYRLLQISC